MFITNHFTFPLAIGTFVGPGVIDVGIAAKQLTVVQYQDATNFNVHSIDGNSGQRIESIFDHNCLRTQRSIAALQCTQIVRHFAEFLQHCRITKRSGVGIAVATKSYCTRIANFSRHNLGSHNGMSQVR